MPEEDDGMRDYPEAAMERAMKVHEVILRAMAKRMTWWQAAEILGITDRSMRRWRARMEKEGFRGVMDRRVGRKSPQRVRVLRTESCASSFGNKCSPFNVTHLHEKMISMHGTGRSDT